MAFVAPHGRGAAGPGGDVVRQARADRTEHLKLVAQYLGWRSAGQLESKLLTRRVDAGRVADTSG
ncbi:MAG: hypothetical protein ACRDRE_08485, partial [Pseudonocardiaceae bacterium]